MNARTILIVAACAAGMLWAAVAPAQGPAAARADDEAVRELGDRLLGEAERQHMVNRRMDASVRGLDRLIRDLLSNDLLARGRGPKMKRFVKVLSTLSESHVPSAERYLDQARKRLDAFRPNVTAADVEIQTILRMLDELLKKAERVSTEDDLLTQLRLIIKNEETLHTQTREWGRLLYKSPEDAETNREDLTTRQEQIGANVRQFEEKLNAAAESEADPMWKLDLAKAAKLMKDRTIDRTLDRAAKDIEAKKPVPAVQKQGDAIEALKEIERLLERHEDSPLNQLEQMKTSHEKLNELLEKQEKLREKTERKEPEEFQKDAPELQLEQRDLKKETEQAAEEMPEAADEKIKQPLEQAEQHMDQAEQAMEQPPADDQTPQQQQEETVNEQKQAEEALKQAITNMEQQMAAMEEQLAQQQEQMDLAEQMEQAAEQAEAMVQRQEQLNQLTQQTPQQELAQLEPAQQQLAEEAREMAEAAGEMEQEQAESAMEEAGEQMEQAAQAMEQGEKPETQQHQQQALEALKQAAQQMRQAAQQQQQLAQQQQQQPPQPSPPQPSQEKPEEQGDRDFGMQKAGGRDPRDRKLWDHLTPREREALKQSFARELPLEYRELLEDYYDALSK